MSPFYAFRTDPFGSIHFHFSIFFSCHAHNLCITKLWKCKIGQGFELESVALELPPQPKKFSRFIDLQGNLDFLDFLQKSFITLTTEQALSNFLILGKYKFPPNKVL